MESQWTRHSQGCWNRNRVRPRLTLALGWRPSSLCSTPVTCPSLLSAAAHCPFPPCTLHPEPAGFQQCKPARLQGLAATGCSPPAPFKSHIQVSPTALFPHLPILPPTQRVYSPPNVSSSQAPSPPSPRHHQRRRVDGGGGPHRGDGMGSDGEAAVSRFESELITLLSHAHHHLLLLLANPSLFLRTSNLHATREQCTLGISAFPDRHCPHRRPLLASSRLRSATPLATYISFTSHHDRHPPATCHLPHTADAGVNR